MKIVIKEPRKIDENTIIVTKDILGMEVSFTYDFLISQRKKIQDEIEQYNAMKQIELDEIDKILGECKKLGIGVK